jgi:hypothetical protein
MDPNQENSPVNEEPVAPSFDAPTTESTFGSAPSEEVVAEQPAIETEPASTPVGSAPVIAAPETALPAPAPVAAIPAVTNPGHTLGIVSLILSLLGVGLIGLILGIVGLKKSKSAGHGNGLALAGIIIGGINIVVIVGIVLLMSVMAVLSQCADLGAGTHVLSGGTTITCN